MFGDRHAIVTLIVIERMAYLSVFLNIMTAMTLMTVICEGFLGTGVHLLCAASSAVCLASSPFPLLYRDIGMVMIDLQGYLRLGNLVGVPRRSSRT